MAEGVLLNLEKEDVFMIERQIDDRQIDKGPKSSARDFNCWEKLCKIQDGVILECGAWRACRLIKKISAS